MDLSPRSEPELENIAEHFLAEHISRCFSTVQTPIEEIIEDRGAIIYPKAELGRFCPGFLPLEGRFIFVDEEMQASEPHEYRFTLAEEMAHQLIHAPFFAGWHPDDVRRFMAEMPPREYQRLERDARYLAACILMPGKVFSEHMQRFTRIILTENVARHHENVRLHGRLSDVFNVALTAVERRCREVRRGRRQVMARPRTFSSSSTLLTPSDRQN